MYRALLLLAFLVAPAVAQEEIPDELSKAREAIVSKLTKEQRDQVRTHLEGARGLNADNNKSMPRGARGTLHTYGLNEDFKVDEIIDERNMLIHDYRLWIEGVDTSELVDGDRTEFPGRLFEVKGSKTYETVDGGTATVKHLVVVEFDFEAREAAAKLRRLLPFRLWQDDSGKFSIVAKFIAFKGGNVTLERLDGKKKELPISRLSKDDQTLVREMVKRRAAAKAR
jgi:hypothetical protein